MTAEGPVPILRFEDITKVFKGDFPALEHIAFTVMPGEFISLVGPSGAGKSTILKLIYAEEEPTEGKIFFNGRDISLINRKHLPFYRRNIGTVFQHFKLLPQKTVFENVAYALEVYGKTTEDIEHEVPEILDIVGLLDKGAKFPKQLSGGEQQRVSLARALIVQPKIIVADEPMGNLDPVSAEGIMNLLVEINKLGTTVMLATHNQSLVDKLGRRVIALEDGKIMSDEMHGKYVFTQKPRKV